MRCVTFRSLVRSCQLRFPGHVVVGPAMLLRSCVDVQSLLSQVHGATFVLLYPTLALVSLATAFACRQLVKNCPSTHLMTHNVRELSQSLVWSGLSLTVLLQVTHPLLVQQVLHQHCKLHQASGKLWRPPKKEFLKTSSVTLRSPVDILQPVSPASNLSPCLR